MFSNGIRMAGAAVIAVLAMMAFASGAAAQACPECEEYQLDIPEPEPEPVPEAPVPTETPVAPVVGEEPVEVVAEPEKKRKPKPEPLPFVNPYEGLGLSQPLAFQRGDAASALTRAGFVIPMGISLLVMAGLLIRSRRQLASARDEAARNSSQNEGW